MTSRLLSAFSGFFQHLAVFGDFSVSLAFSLTLTSSTPYFLRFSPSTQSLLALKASSLPPFPFASPWTIAAHLLALLGSLRDAVRVPSAVAQEIRSCLRPLVPFSSPPMVENVLLLQCCGTDNMVWWPPELVMELARLAFDSGGDPSVIQSALDPTSLPVPNVENCQEDKCQLTTTPYGYRFINLELNHTLHSCLSCFPKEDLQWV